MDIARVQAYAQEVEDHHRGHQPERDFDRGQHKKTISVGYYGAGQSCRASDSQMNRGSHQSRPPLPHCPYCDKAHSGKCHFGTNACFTYSHQGHIMRDCPYRGSLGSAVQPTGPVAGLSSFVAMRFAGQIIQTPAGHGRGHGRTSSSSFPLNRVYALTSRRD
ncbi:uncharacterized protein LOC129883466 [Solanum dulcamara]|uniref:uncharacterized protein LOC129883466 n=1 Tax=Solanum dulcamara TaxID=45834 RepID=UPI002485152E|nr:uncharacterized protein LOC129883466 [Solanum dulcamara]